MEDLSIKMDLQLSFVMSSDEDQMIVEDVLIGFDKNLNLLVELKHSNYEEKEYSSSIFMCMEEEEAYNLARRLHTSLHELPTVIGDFFGEKYSGYVNPCCYDVHTCFKEILDFLLDYGCHYRIVEQPGKDDYIYYPSRPKRPTMVVDDCR